MHQVCLACLRGGMHSTGFAWLAAQMATLAIAMWRSGHLFALQSRFRFGFVYTSRERVIWLWEVIKSDDVKPLGPMLRSVAAVPGGSV